MDSQHLTRLPLPGLKVLPQISIETVERKILCSRGSPGNWSACELSHSALAG